MKTWKVVMAACALAVIVCASGCLKPREQGGRYVKDLNRSASVSGYIDSRGHIYGTSDLMNIYNSERFENEYFLRYFGKRRIHCKMSDMQKYYLYGIVEGEWIAVNYDNPTEENLAIAKATDAVLRDLNKRLAAFIETSIKKDITYNQDLEGVWGDGAMRDYVSKTLDKGGITIGGEGIYNKADVKIKKYVSRRRHPQFQGNPIGEPQVQYRTDAWYMIDRRNFYDVEMRTLASVLKEGIKETNNPAYKKAYEKIVKLRDKRPGKSIMLTPYNVVMESGR